MKVQYRLPEAVVISPTVLKRPGDPASMTIKAVCKPCNNNWMGDIEQLAAPVMTPLLLGQNVILSSEEQRIIVNWAVLKTIVGEYDDSPESRSIDQETQQAFYTSRELRGVWKIWIGRYKGKDWKTRYRHAPYFVGSKLANPLLVAGVINPPKMNTQVSTFAGGQLYISVLYSRSPLVEPFGFQGLTGAMLRQIWPLTGESLVWPPPVIMGDDDAEFVARAFEMSSRAT